MRDEGGGVSVGGGTPRSRFTAPNSPAHAQADDAQFAEPDTPGGPVGNLANAQLWADYLTHWPERVETVIDFVGATLFGGVPTWLHAATSMHEAAVQSMEVAAANQAAHRHWVRVTTLAASPTGAAMAGGVLAVRVAARTLAGKRRADESSEAEVSAPTSESADAAPASSSRRHRRRRSSLSSTADMAFTQPTFDERSHSLYVPSTPPPLPARQLTLPLMAPLPGIAPSTWLKVPSNAPTPARPC